MIQYYNRHQQSVFEGEQQILTLDFSTHNQHVVNFSGSSKNSSLVT